MKLRIALHDWLLRKLWASTRTQIEAVVPGCGGVAFLGDSITHLGKWDLLFPQIASRNFGIGGERSDHLLARIGPLLAMRPERLFLLIGTNDLGVGIPIEDTASNVDRLVEQLKARLPDCMIVLQGVMPRARRYQQRIHQLNQRYAQIAQRREIVYLDLFPAFDDGSGALRSELTDDGLHLNGAGYRIWRDLLRPLVLDSRVAETQADTPTAPQHAP